MDQDIERRHFLKFSSMGVALAGAAALTSASLKTEQAYAQAMSEVPLRRMSNPEDIAGTVAWLLSPDARGVTGQAIDQNGGAFVL